MVRQQKNEELMAAGVTLIDPATTYVDADVVVGADTVIYPVRLSRRLNEDRRGLRNPGRRAHRQLDHRRSGVCAEPLLWSLIPRSSRRLFWALRSHPARVGCRQGRARRQFRRAQEDRRWGQGAKANHLAYLGDATIGAKINVGAGTITCNYDGENKHQTVIDDGVFIGSDTQLVAPVTLGDGAYVAAGSAITEDVPAGALAIGAGRQENKAGWTAKRDVEKD